jgi:quercetin dioxygenase-like cupin family protein
VTLVQPLADFQRSSVAWLFEGHERAGLSFFVTEFPPGEGPGPHFHPYEEVFLVEEGEATFTVADEEVVVPAGSVVVVPPETVHGFATSGERPSRIVSIHPSARVEQTFV